MARMARRGSGSGPARGHSRDGALDWGPGPTHDPDQPAHSSDHGIPYDLRDSRHGRVVGHDARGNNVPGPLRPPMKPRTFTWRTAIVFALWGILVAELMNVPPFSRWLDALGDSTWEGLPWVLLGLFWGGLGYWIYAYRTKQKETRHGEHPHTP